MWRSNNAQRSFPYAVPLGHLLVQACSRVDWCACHAHAVLPCFMYVCCCALCMCVLACVCVVLDSRIAGCAAALCACACGAGLKNGGFPQQISLLFWFYLFKQVLKHCLRRQIYGVWKVWGQLLLE